MMITEMDKPNFIGPWRTRSGGSTDLLGHLGDLNPSDATKWPLWHKQMSGVPYILHPLHDDIVESRVDVLIVNLLDGLGNVKTVRPIFVNGINGAVITIKSGMHMLFKGCLSAPLCRFSFISHHNKQADRYHVLFDSDAAYGAAIQRHSDSGHPARMWVTNTSPLLSEIQNQIPQTFKSPGGKDSDRKMGI